MKYEQEFRGWYNKNATKSQSKMINNISIQRHLLISAIYVVIKKINHIKQVPVLCQYIEWNYSCNKCPFPLKCILMH